VHVLRGIFEACGGHAGGQVLLNSRSLFSFSSDLLANYSQVLPNMQEKAVKAMEDIFKQETDEEQSLPQEEES
jgi:hypothetical protein